jgi:hypothetical protein
MVKIRRIQVLEHQKCSEKFNLYSVYGVNNFAKWSTDRVLQISKYSLFSKNSYGGEMKKRTVGAWLVNHTRKLMEVASAHDFEDIEFAGKCGIFLSNLSSTEEDSDLRSDQVASIARVSNIRKTELETITNKLKEEQLIDIGKDGSISVLGVTSASILAHTSEIFKNLETTNFQKAAIVLSEDISDQPKDEIILKEQISDQFKLSAGDISSLFSQSEAIGFIDYEMIDDKQKFYFNGNLFRRDAVQKASAIFSGLREEDNRRIATLDAFLSKNGCCSLEEMEKILGPQLRAKLHSIGMYDLSEVSNPKESRTFVTKPAAFNKYGNPFEEDALDLAKAFVASLYYGMNYSSTNRGKITMLPALLRKLLRGREVGPTTAIGEDYKILELKRVIQLRRDSNEMYYMKLLKKDIGELALQVLELGDASPQAVNLAMSSGSVTKFLGPEEKRVGQRKTKLPHSDKDVANLLRTLRA